MTEKYTVSFLQTYAPKVRAVIEDIFPEKYDVRFTEAKDEAGLRQAASGADFIIAGKINSYILGDTSRLRLIHKWGIGLDKIDLDSVRAAGVPLIINAGCNALPVAEHAVMLMLGASRRVSYVDRKLRNGEWVKTEMRSICTQVNNKTVGFFGFGNIGQKACQLLAGFNCNIIYHDERVAGTAAAQALNATHVSFDELLARSDIISLHAPAIEGTIGRFSRDAFAKMKDGVVFVNTARGALVDEAALVEALQSGKVAAAGLDCFVDEPPPPSHPLLSMDQVVLTPHSGGGVFDNVPNVANGIVRNLERHFKGEAFNPADVIVP